MPPTAPFTRTSAGDAPTPATVPGLPVISRSGKSLQSCIGHCHSHLIRCSQSAGETSVGSHDPFPANFRPGCDGAALAWLLDLGACLLAHLGRVQFPSAVRHRRHSDVSSASGRQPPADFKPGGLVASGRSGLDTRRILALSDGSYLLGGTEYFFDAHYPLWVRLFSLFHVA